MAEATTTVSEDIDVAPAVGDQPSCSGACPRKPSRSSSTPPSLWRASAGVPRLPDPLKAEGGENRDGAGACGRVAVDRERLGLPRDRATSLATTPRPDVASRAIFSNLIQSAGSRVSSFCGGQSA